ncbi:hypothetical protein ACFT2C_04725 [Promicromonospora sp. NPDC057138]|uniref:hypothetical protein n=1 Tax=Promicromonospora sp. NPDC057138 TaxID=3346031 RepID=UPI00363B8D52
MSDESTPEPVRRIQAGSLQMSVSFSKTVYDEEAGYALSEFRTTITDADHGVAAHDDSIRLEGTDWSLDDAAAAAFTFLADDMRAWNDPNHPDFDRPDPEDPGPHPDPDVARALLDNADELRALDSIFDTIDAAGLDPGEVLGRVDAARTIDRASLTGALNAEPGSRDAGRSSPAARLGHAASESASSWSYPAPTAQPKDRDDGPRL